MNNQERELGPNQRAGHGDLLPAFWGMKIQKVNKICQACGTEFEAYDIGPLSRRFCFRCAASRIAQEEEDMRALQAAKDQEGYHDLIRRAGVPPKWREVTFENSDASLNKTAFKVAKKYAETYNPSSSGTLIFYSRNYGRGKTHLAVCILNYVLHHHHRPVLFKKARDLLLEIRHTFSEKGTDTEADILNEVLSIELLLLDDVGVDTPSPWIESTYWTIFDRRLEWQLPTIVTANYPLEPAPGEVCLGDRIGYGALSRLKELSQANCIDMSGPDLR